MGAFGCFGDQKETIPVTPAQIIHARRAHVLEQAALVGVTAACRAAGVSRKSYYEWAEVAARYGLEALTPKDRRPPVMPNAMSEDEVATILAVAIAQPTLGARQLVDELEEFEVFRSASGVQKILRRHNLGHRRQRVAVLASLTAADGGTVTDAALEGPFGFCLAATDPGQVVSLDTFVVGKLKGVGCIYQFTAVDVATRWAICQLVIGDKSAHAAARFVDHLHTALADLDITLQGVLTDNGPEFTGNAFRDHLAELGLNHHRIPPRSPNHNAVCERFQGTALHEFYRRLFHRVRIDRLDQLDSALQSWLHRYNTRRRNRGDYMNGRTPLEVLTTLRMRDTA